MASSLIQAISDDLRGYGCGVLRLRKSPFFSVTGVCDEFKINEINVVSGTSIELRVAYELRDQDQILILLYTDNQILLEDIFSYSVEAELDLGSFLIGYHLPTLYSSSLLAMDEAYINPHYTQSTSLEWTHQWLKAFEKGSSQIKKDYFELRSELESLLQGDTVDWYSVPKLIGKAVSQSLKEHRWDEIRPLIGELNTRFQEEMKRLYYDSKVASPIRQPKNVCKIREHIEFKFKKTEKVCLLVIDGFGYWQWSLLREQIRHAVDEMVVFSWLPSITQLSRQAIFKGEAPSPEYKQNPTNEERLWKAWCEKKELNKSEWLYLFEKELPQNLYALKRLSLVYGELDRAMHSSVDYNDLYDLTENWIERAGIVSQIDSLVEKGFTIFLTTDHGNVHSKGWRGLSQREKLGTHKSGSRSERHLEYSENFLFNQFIEENEELNQSLIIEERKALYFKDEYSFSNKESLVSHGGAHLMEVLVPFIKIHRKEND